MRVQTGYKKPPMRLMALAIHFDQLIRERKVRLCRTGEAGARDEGGVFVLMALP